MRLRGSQKYSCINPDHKNTNPDVVVNTSIIFQQIPAIPPRQTDLSSASWELLWAFKSLGHKRNTLTLLRHTRGLIYESFCCDSLIQLLNLANPHHTKHFIALSLRSIPAQLKQQRLRTDEAAGCCHESFFLLSATIDVLGLKRDLYY